MIADTNRLCKQCPVSIYIRQKYLCLRTVLNSMITEFPSLNCSHFKSTYASARSHFLNITDALSHKFFSDSQHYLHPLPGPAAEQLFCDSFILSYRPDFKNVLIIISGTHGVEGLMGSAVQASLLQMLESSLAQYPDTGFLFIHALNPWGMAWSRRCDHEGIDINRNFIDFNHPLPANTAALSLLSLLQQETVSKAHSIHQLWEEQGINVFTENISQGQYEDCRGLFFGGHAASWSRQVITSLSNTSFLQQAQRIIVLDLHSGLGPYGYGEVINDHQPGSSGFKAVGRIYGQNSCAVLLNQSCSTPKTGLLDYFWHEYIGNRGCFTTLEFGTYALQRFFEVLIQEQQEFLRHPQRAPSSEYARQLLDYFYPHDISWQQQVLFRSWQIFGMAVEDLDHD